MNNHLKTFNTSFLFRAFCFGVQSLLRNPYLCLLPIAELAVRNKKSSRLDLFAGSLAALLLLEPGSGLNYSEVQASPFLLRYAILAIMFFSAISITRQPTTLPYIVPPLFLLASVVSAISSLREYFSYSEALTQFVYISIVYVLATRRNDEQGASSPLNFAKTVYLLGSCFSLMLLFQYFLDASYLNSFAILSSASELKFFPLLSCVIGWRFFGYLRSIPIFLIALISLSVQLSRTSFICLIVFISLCTMHYLLGELRRLSEHKVRIMPLIALLIVGVLFTIGFALISSEEAPLKTLAFIYKVVDKSVKNEFNIKTFLVALDPVRAFEWETWLNSGIKEFLFGSGLGTGISLDPIMNLPASTLKGSYTSNELMERVAFGFHDIFTWFGISIGMIGLAILSLPFVSSGVSVIKSKTRLDLRGIIFSIGMLLAFANAWYSLSGIILISSTNSIASRHDTSPQ